MVADLSATYNNQRKIDAVILAGGFGTRLRPIIRDMPKPLAPVNGYPFLDMLLGQLHEFRQIRRVILAVGYMADKIVSRYRENKNYGFDIQFSTEAIPLGTGGAIKKAISLTESDDILVMNGDSFCEYDFSALRQLHEERAADITFVVTEVPEAARYSLMSVDPATRRVTLISSKASRKGAGFINAGCYLLKRRIFDKVPDAQALSFEDHILPSLLSNAYALTVCGKFIDIGTPESYMLAKSDSFWRS